MFDINPLNILNNRKLSFIPKQFSKTLLHESYFGLDSVDTWIQNRLRGRYSIASMPTVDKDGKFKTATFVAFEDQKELTYFMLACPHLRRN